MSRIKLLDHGCCSKCALPKEGKHSWCRKCLREDQYARRKANPNKAKEIAKKNRQKTYKILRDYLDDVKSKPCMDCKRKFPRCVMQFDHRDPTTKRYAVATMARHTITLENLKREIEKCDLVCANCHAIRTWITRKK